MDDVVPVTLQRLQAADIIRMAGLAVASMGQEYSRIGAVHGTMRQGSQLLGIVNTDHLGHEREATATNPTIGAEATTSLPDTSPAIHTSNEADGQQRCVVNVELQTASTWIAQCTCSPGSTTMCSHAAALLYEWLAHSQSFTSMSPPSATVSSTPLKVPREASHALSSSVAASTSKADALPAGKLANAFSQGGAGHIGIVRGPTPTASLGEILSHIGLSELRGIAREYDVATTGLNKQQLTEAITDIFKRPEVVRKVAAALEKPQRQLLATMALAGGSMTDEDVRGLYERFAFGQPNKLQAILVSLQAKGLLFHTSLNSAPQQRIGLGGSVYDVGWYIPGDVYTALHVSVPITPFNVERDDEDISVEIQQVQPYSLLTYLLLVGRILDGVGAQLLAPEIVGMQSSASSLRPPRVSILEGVGAQLLAPPAGLPSAELLATIQEKLARSPLLVRYAVQLLRQADILHKDDNGSPYLRLLPNAARLLLGPSHIEIARDLFELWVTSPGYEELYELQEEGLYLRCRTTPLNHSILRPGELEAENCEARRWLVALIAKAPREQWISFTAFARFIYRLNPTFLQKRQRLFPSPHWWLEQEEGRTLQPNVMGDWMRAEGHYVARMIRGPLHWWGVTELAISKEGRLLAFRLAPMVDLLLHRLALEDVGEQFNMPPWPSSLEVIETGELLVDCSFEAWPLLELLEDVTKVAGVRDERLCYELSPKVLAEALGRGKRPDAVLHVLQEMAKQEEQEGQEGQEDSPLQRLIAKLSSWTASYGRVRLYTEVSLLEVADNLVMRELIATTSVEEQVVQSITPTLMILKKQGMERMIEELKRRGQTPLLHEGEDYLGDESVETQFIVPSFADENTKGMQYGTE